MRSSASENSNAGAAIPQSAAAVIRNQSTRAIVRRAAGTSDSATAPRPTLPKAIVPASMERSAMAIQRKAEPKMPAANSN
jgi:hypothetical protein